MTEKEYTPAAFYRHLKLNIWLRGQVAGWGLMEKLPTGKGLAGEKAGFHIRSLKNYGSSSLIKKQLGLGIYLLDFVTLRQDSETGETISLLVIAVCRNVRDKEEAIHYLRLTAKAGPGEISHAVSTGQALQQKRKRKSIFRKKPSRATFDYMPVNAVLRKH